MADGPQDLLRLADVSCRMCFGTGKTPRYRGPQREGPCIYCHGSGFICSPARAHSTKDTSNVG